MLRPLTKTEMDITYAYWKYYYLTYQIGPHDKYIYDSDLNGDAVMDDPTHMNCRIGKGCLERWERGITHEKSY
jgi:hypothetical protein